MKFIPSLQMTGLIRAAKDLAPAELLKRVTEDGFYRAVETRVLDELEGRAFVTACMERGIHWVSWASNVIYDEGLNLTSLDAGWRRHSLERVAGLMECAARQGAGAFAFLSGARPERDEDLPEAMKLAEESMCELAARAAQYADMRLLIEPLDRDVHKRAAIGTAAEAASVIRAARREHRHVYMVWDSAHMKLQEGDLSASICAAGDTVGHIHLCDAVIDPSMPLYGDYHPMPGVEGGFLDEACMQQILLDAAQLNLPVPELPVTVEAKPSGDPWMAEAEMRRMLARVLPK